MGCVENWGRTRFNLMPFIEQVQHGKEEETKKGKSAWWW